jgi:hypothetical protein
LKGPVKKRTIQCPALLLFVRPDYGGNISYTFFIIIQIYTIYINSLLSVTYNDKSFLCKFNKIDDGSYVKYTNYNNHKKVKNDNYLHITI